jgi:hypothetical protein
VNAGIWLLLAAIEQVGDFLGDRALARPVDPGEQHTLGPALIHLARLGRCRGLAPAGSDWYGRSGSEECLPKRDECAERGEYPNVEAG